MRSKLPEKQIMKPKKGLWSPDEDQKLTHYVMNYGHGCWSSVPINAGLQRNGKSCRLRWINYLRPGLKRGAFSSQEDETILTLHRLLGNKWSLISRHLPGRTDNEIKNYWHTHLKKKLNKSEQLQDCIKVDCTHSNIASKESSSSCLTSNFTNSSSTAMVQSVQPASQISNLPKLLFADWASLDEFVHDFSMPSDQPLISPGSNSNLSTIEHEWKQNEGPTNGNENRNCVDTGSNESVLHMQMTIDQIFEFDDVDFNIDNLFYM